MNWTLEDRDGESKAVILPDAAEYDYNRNAISSLSRVNIKSDEHADNVDVASNVEIRAKARPSNDNVQETHLTLVRLKFPLIKLVDIHGSKSLSL